MTEVAVVTITEDEARRLTERIRYTALSVRDGMEKLQRLVQEAKDGNAHAALGYASWTAYLADTLGAEPLRLPRDQRQELVGYLAGEGMSVPAIAAVTGVVDRTVQRDFRRAEQLVTSVTTSPEPDYVTDETDLIVNRETGEILDTPPAPKVTGLDGKTYSRPEPREPKAAPRRALTDQFFDAAYDLTKAVERIERLAEDNRFTQNAEKVAAKHRSDLLRAIDALQRVADRLDRASA